MIAAKIRAIVVPSRPELVDVVVAVVVAVNNSFIVNTPFN
jgi:hypothetical protein